MNLNFNNLQNLPQANWVNQQTWAFIQSLSFNGYVLAGNSITNMIQGIPLQGDLDFWASERSTYMKAFEQISKYYETFHIYPSMIQMHNSKNNLPKVNLVFTNLTPMETIQKFDFDYCRCYWMPKSDIIFGTGCQESIRTKIIRSVANQYSVMKNRILKAIKYGYIFEKTFWGSYYKLIINPRLLKQLALLGRQSELFPVRIEDLNMNQFIQNDYHFKLKDIKNISETLKQLTKQFELLCQKKNVKLPVLLKLNKNKIKLIKQYIKSIIFQNPLSDSHYMQIRIGTSFINYGDRYRDFQDQDQNQNQKSNQEEGYMSNQQQDHGNSESQISQEEFSEQKKQEILQIKQLTNTIISDDFQSKTIILNKDASASINISYLSVDLANDGFKHFNQMWEQCPKQIHKIIMHEKEVQVSRFSKSYLFTPNNKIKRKRSYMYSGFDTSKNNQQLPYIFKSYYYEMRRQDRNYNQVIVNWYRNQEDFIAPHADCQRGMIQNAKISIVSFYPSNDSEKFRYLEIIPKKNTKSLSQKFFIRLEHGMIITMMGKTQDDFLHGIRKQNKPCLPRISLSFRQMDVQS